MTSNIVICQGCEKEMEDYDNVFFKHDLPFCEDCHGDA